MIVGTDGCGLQRLGCTAMVVLVGFWAVIGSPAIHAWGQDPVWSHPAAEIWYRGRWVNRPKVPDSPPMTTASQGATGHGSAASGEVPGRAYPPPEPARLPNPLRHDSSEVRQYDGHWRFADGQEPMPATRREESARPGEGLSPAGDPATPASPPVWPQASDDPGRATRVFAPPSTAAEDGSRGAARAPGDRGPWWFGAEVPLSLIVVQLLCLVITVVVIVVALARFGKRLPSVLQIELVNSHELGEQLGWQRPRSPFPGDEPGNASRRAAADTQSEREIPASSPVALLPPTAAAPSYAERRAAEEKRRQERSQSLVKALFEQNLRLQEEIEGLRKTA